MDRYLMKGQELQFNDISGTFTIREVIGRGASCVVYYAHLLDENGICTEHLLKEYNPQYLDMYREDNGTLKINDTGNQELFDSGLKRFQRGYEKQASIRSDNALKNSTSNIQGIHKGYGTEYIDMTCFNGMTYEKVKEKTLYDLLCRVKALTQVVGNYHSAGFLHLDIKPENIFTIPETCELVMLFDFDSVIEKSALLSSESLSYTKIWAAPEQVLGGRKKSICEATDIFAVGEIIFTRIMGRHSATKDRRSFSKYEFDCNLDLLKNVNPKVLRLMQELFRHTICTDVKKRFQSTEELIVQLEELIKLADTESSYLLDSFQYNSACFVGRRQELEEISKKLEKQQLVFLSGIGGIGKTELAKQYANQYRERYNTITFSVFEKDIITLVNEEIQINKIRKEDNESEADFFTRKIKILKEVATPEDLIIIDNFDIDYDENLEVLFGCPCKFLITTRRDFRDYNYEQINIAKIEDWNEILSLFYNYNSQIYSAKEAESVKALIKYVDYHTMTVELIAKYLRVSGESPDNLYKKFLEKEGTANTDDHSIKQRKDRKLRAESVNNHLSILFDISGLTDVEKELIASFSLLAGTRFRKEKFLEISNIQHAVEGLNSLIKRGWIEYNELTEKISLHQVIQDIVYNNLKPNASNCPNIVKGFINYVYDDGLTYSEKSIRKKVLDIFMNRISGDTLQYARLCMLYGKENRLDEAENICLKSSDKEAFDILQRIYRKKIGVLCRCKDMFETELDSDEYLKYQLVKVKTLLDKSVDCCKKYSSEVDYIVKEYIEIGKDIETGISSPDFWFTKRVVELDAVYNKIVELYDIASGKIQDTSYDAKEKKRLYSVLYDFYQDSDYTTPYKCEYFSDLEKAYEYKNCAVNLNVPDELVSGTIRIEMKDGTTHTSGVSYCDMAQDFEFSGHWLKAIKYYKKAYSEGEDYFWPLYSIANMYLSVGLWRIAIKYLNKIIAIEKEKTVDEDFSHSGFVSNILFEVLISKKQYRKAKNYAYNLISAENQGLEENHTESFVKKLLEAYYCLYMIEKNKRQKAIYWDKCLECYSFLGKAEIDEPLFEFVLEYLKKENNSYKEILGILNQIGNTDKKKIIEKVVKCSSKKHGSNSDFCMYRVLLLLETANYFCQYSNENLKKAKMYCELAKRYFEQYKINDEYVQNMLFKIEAEVMWRGKGYDFEEVMKLRKKCNHKMIAERRIKEDVCSEKDIIEIWKEAANQYQYADDYINEVACIEYAIEIIKSQMNSEEKNKWFDDYWNTMQDYMRATINAGQYKKAIISVEELYNETILYLVQEEEKKECIRKLKALAVNYKDIENYAAVVDIYLRVLYILLNQEETSVITCYEKDIDSICRITYSLLDETIIENEVDQVIDLKEDLAKYREAFVGNIELYEGIIEHINNKYQYKEIEFKS